MNEDALRNIIQTLHHAGYKFPDTCPSNFICIFDPTCVWPPLLDFIHFAWIILAGITGFLLAGWGITMLRGANHDMAKNLRTLVLIFGVLSVALPAVKLLGGENFVMNKCNVIRISQEQIQELVQASNSANIQQENYEHFDIHDSAFDESDEFNF